MREGGFDDRFDRVWLNAGGFKSRDGESRSYSLFFISKVFPRKRGKDLSRETRSRVEMSNSEDRLRNSEMRREMSISRSTSFPRN